MSTTTAPASLECPICFDAYSSSDEARQPWLVGACGHTVCKTCCDNMQRHAGGAETPFTCPRCRAPVHHTTRNYTLIEALDIFQRLAPRTGATCQADAHCDQAPAATVFCVNCDKLLCAECNSAIHRFLGGHEVIVGCDRVERNCARHRTPMVFFCQREECRTAGGCLMCFELDKQSPHYGHPHADMEAVEAAQRAQLERLLADLNRRVTAAQEAAGAAETRGAELFGGDAACGGGTATAEEALVQRAKADIDRHIDERIAQVMAVVAQLNSERAARKREVDEIAAQTAQQLQQFTTRVGEFMSVAHAAQTAAQQVQAQGVRGAVFLQRAAPVVAMLGDVLQLVLDLRVPGPRRLDVAFPPLALPFDVPSPLGRVVRVDDPSSAGAAPRAGAAPLPPALHAGAVGDAAAFVRAIGSQGSGDGNFSYPEDVCVDHEDRLIVPDNGNHRVQVLRRDGTFVCKFGSQGAANGQFSNPCGACVNSAGHIIVADCNNHRVQMFSSDGTFLRTFGSQGAADGQFNRVYGVCVDSHDNIYVADYGNHRIQVFNSEGTFVRKFGTHGNGAGQLKYPVRVRVRRDGNILVSDRYNHRMQEFRADGTFVRAVGSQGSAHAQFSHPAGVCVDGADNIFVADAGNHRIQQFRSDGTFVRAFGAQGGGPAQFQGPYGVCVGADGTLYVADRSNHRIQQFR